MKAALELELFGDDSLDYIRGNKKMFDSFLPGFWDALFGPVPHPEWVAEVTGLDSKYKFARTFLRYKKDYSRSNSKGSRGVYAEYILESGKIYEVKATVAWGRFSRYFCKVDGNGDIIKITETEVLEWLKNRSELTSSQQASNE